MSEPSTRRPSEDLSLEQAMRRLDEIARRLESPDVELSESLELYEEGIGLVRACDGLLRAAEHRIEQLRAEADGFRLDPFEGEP